MSKQRKERRIMDRPKDTDDKYFYKLRGEFGREIEQFNAPFFIKDMEAYCNQLQAENEHLKAENKALIDTGRMESVERISKNYEAVIAENERLRKIELHLNSRIQQIKQQIDDPEILTTQYMLDKYDTLTQLKLDIEQLTKTEKGAQDNE